METAGELDEAAAAIVPEATRTETLPEDTRLIEGVDFIPANRYRSPEEIRELQANFSQKLNSPSSARESLLH